MRDTAVEIVAYDPARPAIFAAEPGRLAPTDFSLIENAQVREVLPRLLSADGRPLQVAGTISDGEQVAGFRAIHLPGHAPGQIALFRSSDRLLLAADVIYTLDAETGQPASACVSTPSATGTPRWRASWFCPGSLGRSSRRAST